MVSPCVLGFEGKTSKLRIKQANETGKMNQSRTDRQLPMLAMPLDICGTRIDAANKAAFVKPIAPPFCFKGNTSPIKVKTKMPTIAPPIAMMAWKISIEAKLGAKKEPNIPPVKNAKPKTYNDLCLYLMTKKLIAIPMIRPANRPTERSWLAAPTETLNDPAMFTRSVLTTTANVFMAKKLKINNGRNRRLLKLLSTLGSGFVMF